MVNPNLRRSLPCNVALCAIFGRGEGRLGCWPRKLLVLLLLVAKRLGKLRQEEGTPCSNSASLGCGDGRVATFGPGALNELQSVVDKKCLE